MIRVAFCKVHYGYSGGSGLKGARVDERDLCEGSCSDPGQW